MRKILLNTIHKSAPNYKKYFALVDVEDFESVSKYSWRVHITPKTKYARGYINGKSIYLHTFLTGFKMTDHINGSGLDNQRSNLRECTQHQNTMNQRLQGGCSSKYKGVSWHKKNKKWMAYIKINGKSIYLGSFLYEHNAALRYNIEAEKLFGKFAFLNVI